MDIRNPKKLFNGKPKAKGKMNNRWFSASAAIAATIILISCAGQPPKEELSKAELAVNKATESKATQIAPLELRKARDHLDQAKQAMQDKKYPEARRLAESAMVEAELAEAKSEAQSAQENVADLQQSLKTMREEMAPK